MLVTFRQICAYYASSTTAKHPFFVKENQWCCTSLRDLIKDTLQRDRKRRKKAEHLAGIEPMSFALRTCALPLCYNPCPMPFTHQNTPHVNVNTAPDFHLLHLDVAEVANDVGQDVAARVSNLVQQLLGHGGLGHDAASFRRLRDEQASGRQNVDHRKSKVFVSGHAFPIGEKASSGLRRSEQY